MVEATTQDKETLKLATISAKISKAVSKLEISKGVYQEFRINYGTKKKPEIVTLILNNNPETAFVNVQWGEGVTFTYQDSFKRFGDLLMLSGKVGKDKGINDNDIKGIFIDTLATNDSALPGNESYKRVYHIAGAADRAKDLFNSPHMTNLIGYQDALVNWFKSVEKLSPNEAEYKKGVISLVKSNLGDAKLKQSQLQAIVDVGYQPHYLVELTYRVFWSTYTTLKDKGLLDII